jgi:putative endonuclease
MSRTERGTRAEQRAAEILAARGYEILDRNYRTRTGEIDLVCVHDGILVFVEVRSATGHGFGSPAESLTATKKSRLLKTAREYLARRGLADRACRFDLVALALASDGSVRAADVIEDVLHA